MLMDQGETIVLVSAHLQDTFYLFGYKETSDTLTRRKEEARVFLIEAVALRPRFEIYPPGERLYNLPDWEDIGSKESSITIFGEPNQPKFGKFLSLPILKAGEAQVKPILYVAVRDFNVEGTEPAVTKEKIRFLSFRAGDLIIVTLEANRQGWFEGYRGGDAEKICGLAPVQTVKQVKFN